MVTIAGVDRGLNLEAITQMEMGQVVDFAIEWNEAHKINDSPGKGTKQEEKPKRRKATQADIDAFWG